MGNYLQSHAGFAQGCPELFLRDRVVAVRYFVRRCPPGATLAFLTVSSTTWGTSDAAVGDALYAALVTRAGLRVVGARRDAR